LDFDRTPCDDTDGQSVANGSTQLIDPTV